MYLSAGEAYSFKIMALFRFTIGNLNSLATRCLIRSIKQIKALYDAEIYILYNGEPPFHLNHLPVTIIDQTDHIGDLPLPVGVAWKLYPPRLRKDSHEIFIDNDLVINDKIPEIDQFLENDNKCLLLEEDTRTYGRFTKHVPANIYVNSGLFGVPPEFDFGKYVKYYTIGKQWEINALGKYAESCTFDEQGLVALILSNQKHIMISKKTITNCEQTLIPAKGNHFIGLNRRNYEPFKKFMLKELI